MVLDGDEKEIYMQITSLNKYVMQKTGGLNLSAEALRELGWERGKTTISLYIDFVQKKLVVVKYDTLLKVSGLHSLFRSSTIGVLGFLTVDKEVRQNLGWEIGDEFRQTLDKNLKGIIIAKVEGDSANA